MTEKLEVSEQKILILRQANQRWLQWGNNTTQFWNVLAENDREIVMLNEALAGKERESNSDFQAEKVALVSTSSPLMFSSFFDIPEFQGITPPINAPLESHCKTNSTLNHKCQHT